MSDDFDTLWEETLREVKAMSVEEWKMAMMEAEQRFENVYPLIISDGDVMRLSEDDDAEDDVPKDVVERAMRLFVARYHYWRL